MSKDIGGGADDVVSVLQEQVRSQQDKITELADEVDRCRRNLKEKETILAAREKVANSFLNCLNSIALDSSVFFKFFLVAVQHKTGTWETTVTLVILQFVV